MLFGAAAQVDSVSETKKSSATLLFWEKKEKILKLAYKAKNPVERTRSYRKNSRNDTVLPEKTVETNRSSGRNVISEFSNLCGTF